MKKHCEAGPCEGRLRTARCCCLCSSLRDCLEYCREDVCDNAKDEEQRYNPQICNRLEE